MQRRAKPFRVADLFCGAGGSSTGAHRALRELGMPMSLVAANHWPVAIETHTRNHPWASHHCVDLETARPRELVPGGVLDLLIASPTCTYHSRARGGRPVNDQQRMDPWHVVRWCTELRVHRLMVENVPEFMDWGPCHATTGRPLKKRRGEYFRAWCDALRAIGFRLDYRVLCCADYGDPTTRRRFFMIGRSDGCPLRWPEPTHAEAAGADLFTARPRWRGAAEIIDWTRQGRSIFGRKKPLAPNTLRRILAGAVRYAWPQPYIDAIQALIDGREPVLDVPAAAAAPLLVHFRGTSSSALQRTALQVNAPLPTLTAGGEHLGLVMAVGSTGAARPVGEPVPTVVTAAAPHYITPLLMGVHGTAQAKPVSEPAPTITTGGASSSNRPGCARPQLIEPLIAPYYGGGSGETCTSAASPLPAATTKARFALAEALVVSTSNSSAQGVPRPTSEPLRTITTARGGDMAMAEPFVLPCTHHGDARTYALQQPLPTVTGAHRGELALAEPFLARCGHGDSDGRDPASRVVGLDEPLPGLTCSNEMAQAAPAAQGVRIDIHYRMLHYRELAGAMSFDDEGEVYDFAGNATEITKQIGNAVPGRTAKALVRALVAP